MAQADIRQQNNTSATDSAPKQNLYTPRGPASAFESSKYRIENLVYPANLMSPEYGGNYVVFYVNEAFDPKLVKDSTDVNGQKVETLKDSDLPPRDRGDLIAMKLSKTQLVAAYGVGAIGVGAALGAITGGLAGAIKGGSVGVVPTVGVGIAASQAASATRSQRRLKTAIALHTPNQLQIRYGMQWSEEDTSALAMGSQAIGIAGDIIKALSNGNKNSDLQSAGPAAAAIATNLALTKAPGAAGVSAATGLAANPKKEQLFKGVDYRTFTFEYQFFPRDSTEAQNVLRIIKEFKYHMHPEFKDASNFVYMYPSEFDIFYYANGRENLNLHRHTSCVLTDLNINYTPNGSFTSFDDGMPTQINVSMGFKELSLLTKDKIKDGL